MLFDRNMSKNVLEMTSKTIQNPSQSSLKTSSKREVDSENGLRDCGQVFPYTPGVKSGRERRGFGRLGYNFPTRRSPFRERSADKNVCFAVSGAARINIGGGAQKLYKCVLHYCHENSNMGSNVLQCSLTYHTFQNGVFQNRVRRG